MSGASIFKSGIFGASIFGVQIQYWGASILNFTIQIPSPLSIIAIEGNLMGQKFERIVLIIIPIIIIIIIANIIYILQS